MIQSNTIRKLFLQLKKKKLGRQKKRNLVKLVHRFIHVEYLSSWFSFLTLNIFPTDNKFQNLTSILYSWKIKIAVEEPATISTTVVDEDSAEVSSSKQEQLPKKLTLMPVIFLIYFEVAGGPYGLEQAVPATGAVLAILGFLVFPFIWSVAEALITAELCTALLGNGGFIIWGERAFGPPFPHWFMEVLQRCHQCRCLPCPLCQLPGKAFSGCRLRYASVSHHLGICSGSSFSELYRPGHCWACFCCSRSFLNDPFCAHVFLCNP